MEQVATAFAGTEISFEVIVIDDGSVGRHVGRAGRPDGPLSVPRVVSATAASRGSPTRCAPAISHSRGDVLVFYPADLQYKPEDIPRLVAPDPGRRIRHGHGAASRGSTRRRSCRACTTGSVGRCSRFRCAISTPSRRIGERSWTVLPIRPDWHRYMIVIAAAEGFSVSRDPRPALSAQSRANPSSGARASSSACSISCRCGSSCGSDASRCCCSGCWAAALFSLGVLTGIVALLMRFVIPPYEGFRPLLNLIEICLILGFLLLRHWSAGRADRRAARGGAGAAASARRAR